MTESTEQIIEDDIIIIDADDVIVANVGEKEISAEQAAKNAQFVENVKGSKAKPLPTTKLNRRINVTKICNEHGYNPAVTLIHIAKNDWKTLGLDKPVSAHEMNSSAQTLLNYTVPNFKPVDFIDVDKEIKQIPTYVPKRGLLTGPNKTPAQTEQEFLENIPTMGKSQDES